MTATADRPTETRGPLLSARKAAELGRTDVEGIRRWAALGVIDRVQTTRGTRYPAAQIRRLLAGEVPAHLMPAPRLLPPSEAARLAGVSTAHWRTIAVQAGALITEYRHGASGHRRYDAAEVRRVRALRDEGCWPPQTTTE